MLVWLDLLSCFMFIGLSKQTKYHNNNNNNVIEEDTLYKQTIENNIKLDLECGKQCQQLKLLLKKLKSSWRSLTEDTSNFVREISCGLQCPNVCKLKNKLIAAIKKEEDLNAFSCNPHCQYLSALALKLKASWLPIKREEIQKDLTCDNHCQNLQKLAFKLKVFWLQLKKEIQGGKSITNEILKPTLIELKRRRVLPSWLDKPSWLDNQTLRLNRAVDKNGIYCGPSCQHLRNLKMKLLSSLIHSHYYKG